MDKIVALRFIKSFNVFFVKFIFQLHVYHNENNLLFDKMLMKLTLYQTKTIAVAYNTISETEGTSSKFRLCHTSSDVLNISVF